METRRRRLWLLLAIPLVLLSGASDATESELEDRPAPSSTDKVRGAMRDTFSRPARQEPLFPHLKDRIQHLPPFLSDTELKFHYRTYEFSSDPPGNGEKSEAWAMGGWVDYHSGALFDVFSTQVKWFFSEPVRAPSGKDGTGLLKSRQRGYNVLGVANAEIRWHEHRLRAFRQELDVPYLNRNDSRMTPNTFESVGLARDAGSLRYGAFYTWRIKLRDSDEFVTMSEAVGVSRDRGVTSVGVHWNPSEHLELSGVDHFATDLFNTLYLDASFGHALTDDLRLKLQTQFTDQRSVGDELLPVADFDTRNLGVRGSASWKGGVLKLGFSITDEDRSLQNPWGSNPSYVDLMTRGFYRAGEKALLGSLSWNFERIGIPDLTFIVNAVHGWSARADDGERLPDSTELDATLDYRIGRGLFRSLWVRLRVAHLHENGSSDGTEFRAILNYDFPLL